MADTKISALTAATAAADTDELAINQGAVSKKITRAKLFEIGTSFNQWRVGDNAAGAKDVVFKNGNDLLLRANPTAGRTVTLPDATASLAALAGQLGGTAESPDVRGLRETGTPTLLTMGAVADGQVLKRSGSTIVGAAGDIKDTLTADYTNNSTTGTAVSNLTQALTAGTYRFSYWLILRSVATTTGAAFGINYTGTHGALTARFSYPGTGTSASSGIIQDDSAGAIDQLVEQFCTRTKSTTAPDLGPLTGFLTANQDCLAFIEGIIVVTGSGNLELWAASEVASSEIRVQTGSNLIITAF